MTYAAAIVALLATGALVPAQPPAPPPAPPGPASEAPLGGPRVAEPARPATLVERDYEGRVKTLESSPEEAALKLLDLSPTERAAAERVLAGRARLLDDFVSQNFELLARSAGAFASNRRAEQLRALMDVLHKTQPLRARGPLIDEMAGVLEAPGAARLRALVAEYWDSLVRDRQAAAEARSGKREPRFAILAREKLELLGREVQRSFQRQLPPGGEQEFDALLASLELRPEQERRVRRMAEEFIIRNRFRPTEAQERRFMLEVTAILDEPQRQRLAAHIARQRRQDMMEPPK